MMKKFLTLCSLLLVTFLDLVVARGVRGPKTLLWRLGGDVDGDHVHIPDCSDVTSIGEESRLRQLQNDMPAPTIGTTKALAVRLVTAGGNEPTKSLEELRGRVMGFGPLKEIHTFRTQYELCSFGQQKIGVASSPADGSGILDGVVQVTFPYEMDKCDVIQGTCQGDIVTSIAQSLGIPNLEAFNFVMICMPSGSTFRGGKIWSAFAYYSRNVSSGV
jgi:hypothetical protein